MEQETPYYDSRELLGEWFRPRRTQFAKTVTAMWQMPRRHAWASEALQLITDEDVCALDERLEIEFLGHAAKWERDTRYVSSMTDVVTHPSYRQIIAMGREKPRLMLSLLLRDMKENERPWFTALAEIAGTNPVGSANAGRVDRMTKAWLEWGKKEGLL